MSTIRVAKRDRFTVISRATLNDSRLSFRARGILAWLLDKPDDWRTTADTISNMGLEGRDAVRAALKELEGCGYLTRRKWRGPAGTWESEWIVRESVDKPGRISSKTTEPGRETSAGSPLRKTRPLTKDLELNTEPSRDELLKSRADAKCVTCKGEGHHFSAMHTTTEGGPRDVACPCTYRADLEELFEERSEGTETA